MCAQLSWCRFGVLCLLSKLDMSLGSIWGALSFEQTGHVQESM